MERSTRQRAAILEVLGQSERPLLPHEVLADAQRAVPGLGIATVYRNLKSLAEEGIVRTVELPHSPARYEARGDDHRHYFYCGNCDRVFPLQGCAEHVDELTPRGFSVERHDITLYGRCDDCGGGRAAKNARGKGGNSNGGNGGNGGTGGNGRRGHHGHGHT